MSRSWWLALVFGACSAPTPHPPPPPPAPIVRTAAVESPQLAAGAHHTCLLEHREVWCWGKNDSGQLGDGTRDEASRPIRVVGVVQPTAIALGNEHTCALGADGDVSCWGRGKEGQIGDGGDSMRPIKIPLTGRAVEIAAGHQHTCARLEGGAVACWGHDGYGELGGASRPGFLVPGLAAVTSLRIGTTHSCVIGAGSRVLCWGGHWLSGFFGSGHDRYQRTPAEVPELAGVSEIAVGAEHVCGRKQGDVVCFGATLDGQLGDPTIECCKPARGSPQGVNDVAALSAGFRHTCALRKSGSVVCWGGQESTDGRPRPIAGLTDVTQIAAGAFHTCAMRATGEIMCWGDDENGQLGRGVAGRISHPVHVPALADDTLGLALGYIHSCARRAGGVVSCWGPDPEQASPGAVPELGIATQLTSGIYETCALQGSGVVRCVQRGRGPFPAGTITVPGGVATLAHGGAGICARTTARRVACVEEISDAHALPGPLRARTAVVLNGFSDVDLLAVGDHDVCSVGKQVQCAHHESGLFARSPGTSPWSAPTVIRDLVVADITAIAAGDQRVCVLLRGGRISCWGAGSTTPALVKGIDDAVELAVGARHACARRKDGSVWCWGDDAVGQLGDGDQLFEPRSEPARVANLEDTVEIGAGGHHTCARTKQKGVFCWGSNEHGRLGFGVVPRSAVPVTVVLAARAPHRRGADP
jgi:alpha-tubulin suppressor-like RCC1 family protein